ncbi:MAG TPA: hypothetical protein VFS83_16310 [Ktedonobacterales bacterium]|nr:hypothetical protein [Ktedonobacterales bacterium]
MIPWMRMRGNPLALVPIIGAVVAAGIIYARIFTRGELGTGQDIAHLLIVLALLQTALVLDLFLQFAVAHRRALSLAPDSWAEHVLRMAQRLQWLLLVVPALAIILMVRMPLTPQILFKPGFTFAWVVLLLNIFPLTAGYLLLAVTKPVATPVASARAASDDASDDTSDAGSPDPTPDPDLETQTQTP